MQTIADCCDEPAHARIRLYGYGSWHPIREGIEVEMNFHEIVGSHSGGILKSSDSGRQVYDMYSRVPVRIPSTKVVKKSRLGYEVMKASGQS